VFTRLFTKKTRLKVLTILIFFVDLFIACTSDEPVKPEIKTFREQMLVDFNLLKPRIISALEKDNPIMAAGEVIEQFLLELKSNDRRIFGIGLLDTSGEYLTGFVVDNNTGKLIKDKYKGINFHSFEVVEQIVKSEKVMQERLYLQNARILAIGFPVIEAGDLLGILCFTFNSNEFKQEWGIDEEDFLKIDFGKV
jgi:hypothetical protein